MPLDAICLSAVRQELAGRITGMKIDKVQQPERDVIILTLRGKGSAAPCRLLISSGAGDARVHLTEHQFENPDSPPMFCMLLRKHLIGARIGAVTQPSAERVLELWLEAPDALGVYSEKCLVIELMGRMSNIVLTGGDGIIIDCLRRVGGGELMEKRAILPGLLYRMPPVQEGKLNPMGVTPERWQELFDMSREKTVDKWLLSAFSALSPLICRELSWRAYGETDFDIGAISDGGAALRREFFALMDAAGAGRLEPYILCDADNSPRDFSYTRIMQYEGALNAERGRSFSDMLDGFYTRSAHLARVRQRASATEKTVKTARDRLVRKLAAQHEELKKTEGRDSLRECGELITANLHLMKKGQSVLTAQDFYKEEDGIFREIALDPLKTPQQNAAKYYKEYTKAKNAEKFLAEQIRLGEIERVYLESVLGAIALAEGERDLGEIRRELVQTGYIRAQKQEKRGREKQSGAEPMRFESSSGMLILAGKNNAQNDKLTLKTASKTDVWLHTQKIHGSHVIISCGGAEPDEASLYEAASVAVYYSAARSAGRTPVDYTLVRHVKKPPGGRPGMVVYTNFKTIAAVPDEALIRRLRRG